MVSQAVLSAKHLLTTVSESIEFSDDFYRFFNLVANEVTLNNDIENDEYELSDFSLVIIKENVAVLSELNEGELNEYVTLFSIKNNKTGEYYEIREKSEKEMYLTSELVDLLGLHRSIKDVYELNFDDIPEDTALFLIEVTNSELTKPLYAIMGLLDTKEHRKQMNVENMHQLAQSMLDLIIESNIGVDAVHSEVMLRPLLRSKDNILERPDYSKYDAENKTEVLTVSAALEKHPSVLIGLSFQYLNRQLVSPLTFKKKGTSFVDPFFKLKP